MIYDCRFTIYDLKNCIIKQQEIKHQPGVKRKTKAGSLPMRFSFRRQLAEDFLKSRHGD
jgi:hypothetical protein